MRLTFFLLCCTLASLGGLRAQAQTLPLARLVDLTALPTGLSPDRAVSGSLTDWMFKPGADELSNEPLSWVWWPPSDSPNHLPGAILSLRPVRGGYDVVVRLRRSTLYSQVHREAERAHLAAEVVTCLGCQGERFAAPAYTLALYQGKPEPYPFVLVIHPLPPSTPAQHPQNSLSTKF